MIRAIKTTYRGVVFMSTLEADWAKNLDSLGMVWQYEPEGAKLPSGENYRCDLYLPRLMTWLEVKGPHDQRISKPADLARAVMHAPGCERGAPTRTVDRPSGVAAASCLCGFGEDFPYQNVIIGRPATAGKLTFEAPHGLDAHPVVLICPVCQQKSFMDAAGIPVCRRCRQVATGGQAYRSGQLPFLKIEPPRGRKAPTRKKAAAK